MSFRNFGSFGSIDTSGGVGPGIDVDLFDGGFSADLDAGSDGMDLFVINFSGFEGPSTIGRFEFSGLDFSGGEILMGFTLNPDENFLGVTIEAITPTSIVFNQAADSGVLSNGGIWFSGTFETAPEVEVIPLPAGLPLLLAGLGGLWLLRRRQA